ncbi:MAG: glycosyltransferase family 4 protein [Thermoleophilia bacterium]|nr:glycosyltransferase family 4 protein [Thermoleophilia bacterium]
MPLRVLHLPVNLAGTGWSNVRALRRKGVDAKLLVFRPQRWRPHEHDVSLDIPRGAGLLHRQAKQWRALVRWLPRTDVFHFYFGHTLVPKAAMVPIMRATRKKSLMHFLGDDIRGKSPEELAYGRRFDRQVVGSYAATRWVPDATVVPPGLDLDEYRPVPPVERERPLVVHAPSHLEKKGTRHVVEACAQLPVELDVVHGVPNAEARERYRRADIVVDQLHYLWHGVFTIESMALGKPVVTHLDEEAVRLTEEAFGVAVPIVRATPDSLVDVLRPLVESFEERKRLGEAGRTYVERVHDIDEIADRFVEIYDSL